MKPIIKKYENKDLNIAYNDGYNQAKKKFIELMKKLNYNNVAEWNFMVKAELKKEVERNEN